MVSGGNNNNRNSINNTASLLERQVMKITMRRYGQILEEKDRV